MGRFTPEEIAYLQSQRLGRLATVNEKGDLHVVPVGFRYNPEHDSIDIGGHNIVPISFRMESCPKDARRESA
jgi:pyridoxamine 5'-phosphate oxidase family protein